MKQHHYILNRSLLLIVAILFLVNGVGAQSFDIYIFNIKKGTTKKITRISGAGEFNPAWSPRDNKIVHDVTDTGIFITNIHTGISKMLIGSEGGNDAVWSPTREDRDHNRGKKERHHHSRGIIAFDDFLNLYTLPASGGTRSLFRLNSYHASWNPNGDKIAFGDYAGYIGTRDIRTGNETFVTNYGDRPCWSPDGKYIAFVGFTFAGEGVWVIKVDKWGNPQGAPLQLTTSGSNPTWSANSKTIYYTDWPTGDPDIWKIPATGGTATRVTGRVGGFDKGDYDPAVSHDGKYIAYSTFTDAPPAAQTTTAKVATPLIKSITPNNFTLEQNQPNPFTNATKISFRVASFTHVTVSVYNTTGQKVKTLADADYDAGYYTLNWNGKGNAEKTLPAGIYICQMQAGSFVQAKKMILVK